MRQFLSEGQKWIQSITASDLWCWLQIQIMILNPVLFPSSSAIPNMTLASEKSSKVYLSYAAQT